MPTTIIKPSAPSRTSSGFRNARVRAAQTLPLDWRHLTEVDVANIRTAVEDVIADPKATLFQLETCLLLWATLVTGRNARQLIKLSIRIVSKTDRLEQRPPGLIKHQERWGWWLVAGRPKHQNPPPAELTSSLRPWSAFVYLPATKQVVLLVDRCVRLRNRASAGHVHVGGEAVALFTCGGELIDAVTGVLAGRSGSDAPARRATTTPEALSRWLPAALVHQPGGDVVAASVIAGRVDAPARTPIYYGSVPQDRVTERYAGAVAAVDLPAHHDVPAQLVGVCAGDRLTPTDDAVRALIACLAADVVAAEADLAERHHAMTLYTVALLAFALVHRGDAGGMPSWREVDSETRFCWIDDKQIRGRRSRRLVWICDTAMEQLERYERHLDVVQAAIGIEAARAISALRSSPGLPLFDMREGPIAPLGVPEAVGAAMRREGPLPKNAGRHWMRARLAGSCSTETLHALFGHAPIEEGSWDRAAGLDPVVYRADLARFLDAALVGIGFAPHGPVARPEMAR